MIIRQSTAVDIPVGPFLDSTDGVTVMSALTITQPDIRLSKNAAAFAQKSAAQTASHMENGYYSVNLSTTDTNTVGLLSLHVSEATALPVFMTFQVIEEAIYDLLYTASATGNVTVGSISAGAITAAAIATDAIDADAMAANAIDSAVLATGAITTGTFAAGAINAAAIGADAITAAKIADGAIDAATFAAGAINNTAIATDAIGAAELADGAITALTFATGAIDATAIATDAIGAAELADGAITALTFAAGAIDATAIAADAIGSSELAASAVTEIVAALQSHDRKNTATAGGAATITIDAADNQVDSFYNGDIIILLKGTGTTTVSLARRVRRITGYVSATNVVTVDENWDVQPDNTTEYLILGG